MPEPFVPAPLSAAAGGGNIPRFFKRLPTAMTSPDLDRRFGGIARLYGDDPAARIRAARVCVIGIGGVGSWAAEALARSGVGAITLIDLDNVCESNVNRQCHALDGAYGLAKVEAMAQRIRLIHPGCRVDCIEDFVTADNVATLLAGPFDAVIDAIDDTRAKAAIAAHCRELRLPLLISGGAGGRIDPTRIGVDDLARVTGDPVAARLRYELRKKYGFPRDPKKKFGIDCVYSPEPVRRPQAGAVCETGSAPQGLACAGYGSAMTVTATVGLVAAARVLDRLAAGR